MAVEFLLITFLVASAKSLFFFIITGLLLFAFIKFGIGGEKVTRIAKKAILISVLTLWALATALFALGSVRVVADPATNLELRHYQYNSEPVTIITPEPRTEHLDGFKPLGE